MHCLAEPMVLVDNSHSAGVTATSFPIEIAKQTNTQTLAQHRIYMFLYSIFPHTFGSKFFSGCRTRVSFLSLRIFRIQSAGFVFDSPPADIAIQWRCVSGGSGCADEAKIYMRKFRFDFTNRRIFMFTTC